jgi:hypothetical protein
MDSKQVKSKQRVADHGEVFTAEREVNAMLDLVKNETERIESRFLEPACGDGNFLAEILRRKLAVVKKKYSGIRKRPDFEMWSVIAVMNIYGVELLPDNTAACRDRLFDIWNEAYTVNNKKDASDQCREVVHFILGRNILCGDALTLKDENGKPIIFSEWALFPGGMVKRTDYTLAELMEPETFEPDAVPIKKRKIKPAIEQMSMFDAGADAPKNTEGNRVAQFRPIHYLHLKEQQEGM